jgi:hypothetical protein
MNGISGDKSDNEPDCEDDCRINCSHSRKSLHVLSGFRSTKDAGFPRPRLLDVWGGHNGDIRRTAHGLRDTRGGDGGVREELAARVTFGQPSAPKWE